MEVARSPFASLASTVRRRKDAAVRATPLPPATPRRGPTRHLLAAVVTVAVLVVGCLPPPATQADPVVSGLTIPWDLAFAPDGTILFTQRGGGLYAHAGGATRSVYAPPDLLVATEAGAMGLAIDPGFATNRRVYLCLASTLPGGAGDVRVARLTLNAGLTAVTARTDIVTGIPVNPNPGLQGRHSGCRPRFGPDGALWIGTGDAAIGSVPQDPGSLGGKVLRVTTTGAPAPGNPGGAFDPRVYTYGHRNIQGIAFRPSDGAAFAVEHGTTCDDEVNRLVAGANYGWDPRPTPGDGAYDESRPMTDLVRYPDARLPVWRSGCPTLATSGATFLVGEAWGTWRGGLAIACLKTRQVWVIHLDEAGSGAVAFSSGLQDFGRLRTPLQGPDGALYLTTSNGGGTDRILRVAPVPA